MSDILLDNYEYDKDSLKENITIEQMYELLVELGGEPIQTGTVLLCKTICHGGDSHKLYYYDNTHLFRCYTGCETPTFDIFELVEKYGDSIQIEFMGARPDFIKTMTDIRSSNELRISRVSGELVVPCKLRMITISNPINDEGGNPRFLNTFPNGVMPLMELIKSAEDVSRYDGFLLIPKVENRFNPFSMKLSGKPIPKDCYEEKANWVVTRGVDNVKFDNDVESYIWEKSEELNKLFECNFPLFGTTTSKKLARFCVALASLLMNVDDSFENIIVTKEEVITYVNEEDVKFITLAFCDIYGKQKNVSIMPDELERAFSLGINFNSYRILLDFIYFQYKKKKISI